MNSEKWNDLINKTDKERNNKDFWMSVKRMIGKTNSTEMRYLKGHHIEEIYEDEGKEIIFRETWKKIFQISEEENDLKENYRIVKNQKQQNHQKLNPSEMTDYRTLVTETELITTRKIKNVIKSFKQRAPGEDTLIKYHLERVPPNMIKNLETIYNASFAISYYPQQFKNSLIMISLRYGRIFCLESQKIDGTEYLIKGID